MISIDDRIGSRDLVELLPAGTSHLKRLPYGDAEFSGEGGRLIGFEVKTLSDVLNCISTGRFSGHQLPGLTCRYNVAYLIVEGQFRADDRGILCQPRRGMLDPVRFGSRRFMWADLESWFTTMEMKAGIRIRRTMSRTETAAMILAKWRWFGKPGGHHSLNVFDDSLTGPMPLREPSTLRYIASRLPGIGWVRSKAVEDEFDPPVEMATAGVERWMGIDGIGKKTAEKVVGFWQTKRRS